MFLVTVKQLDAPTRIEIDLQTQRSWYAWRISTLNAHNDRRFLLDVERETLRANPFVEETRLNRMTVPALVTFFLGRSISRWPTLDQEGGSTLPSFASLYRLFSPNNPIALQVPDHSPSPCVSYMLRVCYLQRCSRPRQLGRMRPVLTS